MRLHQQFSEKAQQKMLGYVHELESRIADLPGEIEAGLDPKQIAKMLGESLRQHFLRSGIQDTVSALQTTSAAMTSAQKELSAALRTLSDSHGGVVAQVERANNRIEYSLESRAKTIDALLHEWKSDLLRIWIPMVAGACDADRAVWRHRDTGLPRRACGYTINYSGSASISACGSSSSGKDSQRCHERKSKAPKMNSLARPHSLLLELSTHRLTTHKLTTHNDGA